MPAMIQNLDHWATAAPKMKDSADPPQERCCGQQLKNRYSRAIPELLSIYLATMNKGQVTMGQLNDSSLS
ncbi:hypothetical protein TNCV_808171 [Trichonephila clavipes]|nr:hypothetical protein TNCV_808171 [Trichonephila clavipes]